jgi:hypothetical protein
MEVSGQLHALAALPPGEIALGTHWIDLRAGLDEVEKRKFLPLSGLDPPLLYRQCFKNV